MPSKRKRIGYLPSCNIQEIITNIAKKENLSQSKVVGVLVEEALIARGIFVQEYKNDLIEDRSHRMETKLKHVSSKYSDLDELISDQGVTYNTNKYKNNLDNLSPEHIEIYNKDLFEQFKQFILFKKMLEGK